MTEEKTFRKTKSVAATADAPAHSDIDFTMLEPRDQLKSLLQAEMADKPFSELSSVLFDHRGASIVGHILLDTLEEAGYSVDDFDAVDRGRGSAGVRHDSGGRFAWGEP